MELVECATTFERVFFQVSIAIVVLGFYIHYRFTREATSKYDPAISETIGEIKKMVKPLLLIVLSLAVFLVAWKLQDPILLTASVILSGFTIWYVLKVEGFFEE